MIQVSSPKNDDALDKLSLFTLVVSKHNNISLETIAQEKTLLNGVRDRINREGRIFFKVLLLAKQKNVFLFSAKA